MKLGIFSLRANSLKGADKRKGKLVFTFTCFRFHLFSPMWIRRQFFQIFMAWQVVNRWHFRRILWVPGTVFHLLVAFFFINWVTLAKKKKGEWKLASVWTHEARLKKEKISQTRWGRPITLTLSVKIGLIKEVADKERKLCQRLRD